MKLKLLSTIFTAFFAFIFGLMPTISCSSNKDGDSKDSLAGNHADTIRTIDYHESPASKPHIPIHLTVTHPDNLGYGPPMRYKSRIHQDSIIIYPSSYNYDAFSSGKRFKVDQMPFFEHSEDVEYLCFDAIIINNSTETISIDKLILEVEDSRIDKLPYLYICTVEDTANTLVIADESWTDYGGFSLEYSLLKKGERFDGKYAKKKIFKNPSENNEIDFTDDMKSMGYKFDMLKQKYMKPNESCMLIYSYNDSVNPSELFYPFEWSVVDEGDVYYYIGFCRLYGRITFPQGHAPVEFMANLSLSTEGGFGAALDYNDHFDFQLLPNKKNYQLVRPYNATLTPQSTEKISLKVKCDKSSLHKFKILATSDNDVEISSKPISLHYMMPRNAVQTIQW